MKILISVLAVALAASGHAAWQQRDRAPDTPNAAAPVESCCGSGCEECCEECLDLCERCLDLCRECARTGECPPECEEICERCEECCLERCGECFDDDASAAPPADTECCGAPCDSCCETAAGH